MIVKCSLIMIKDNLFIYSFFNRRLKEQIIYKKIVIKHSESIILYLCYSYWRKELFFEQDSSQVILRNQLKQRYVSNPTFLLVYVVQPSLTNPKSSSFTPFLSKSKFGESNSEGNY